MSRHFKTITVGRGITLQFGKRENPDEKYISIGPDGSDVMLRGAGQVFGFDTWEQLVAALDPGKAAYFSDDSRRHNDE